MAQPPFGFQQQINPDLLNQLVQMGKTSGWGAVIDQGLEGLQQGQERGRADYHRNLVNQISQLMQQQGAPQQGPQLPGVGMGMAGQKPPVSGMGAPPQDNSAQLRGLMMKADPQGMMTAMEGSMFPAQMNPLQQSEIAKNQADTVALKQKPDEIKAQLEEKKREADANRQLRLMQMDMNKLLAEGKHSEALLRLEEMKESVRKRSADAQSARQLKRDTENAKHWFPWTKLPNTEGSGLTPEEAAEFRALDAKFGGKN